MSSQYGEKLKSIRHAEGLTQPEFSKLTGISLGAIRNYETGQSGVGLNVIDRIVKHPKLKKYTMWLMMDEINPEVGQIEPAFSLDGSVKSKTKRKVQSFLTEGKNC
ncbi:helix-turn-helix domain-containing protein [Arsenophonus nasoniae]|uniref:helix-turn-helix domain-containing protein n=1 Tax=Arsenophonus nasoniae TaxID=638 RepID=UPI00387987D0